jgi:hypothetical protein
MNYRTPGVYIEEVSAGSKSVEAVGTSTAGFVGLAPKAGAHVDDPTPILNWLHFRREFVDDENGQPAGPTTHLCHAVFGFFQNGGRLCYVVNTGSSDGPVTGAPGSRRGVDALDLIDEVAIVAAPGYTDAISFDVVLSHCELRKDRVAVLDGPADVDDVSLLTKVATADAPARPSRRAASTPAAEASSGEAAESASAPPPPPPTGERGYRARSSAFGAQYGPWLFTTDPVTGEPTTCPPSGHIAGIWARTDSERGVHKAPANTVVRGASGFTRHITAAEQELLNPVGFNCLRYFPDRGNLVWGARTLSDDPEWKYVNVRRLFAMVEESILKSTRWIVFEPNDRTLWQSIRRDIGAFLMRLWRDGALFGATPEQAFFVKCDEETNPPEVIDAGQVIAIVGIAPVKPAEFVIFKVCQHQAGAEIVSEGAL